MGSVTHDETHAHEGEYTCTRRDERLEWQSAYATHTRALVINDELHSVTRQSGVRGV